MLVYLIVTIIVLGISWGCLRSKFDGYIPVIVFSMIVSLVLTIILNVMLFYCQTGKQKIYEEIDTILVKEINTDKKRVTDIEGCHVYFEDIEEFQKDTTNQIIKIKTRRERDMNLFWKISHNIKIRKICKLDKENYELYEAYLDSLEKGN